jgi:hypothetical protein
MRAMAAMAESQLFCWIHRRCQWDPKMMAFLLAFLLGK